MKYELIIKKGDYALICRGNNLDEYAVVNCLNEEKGVWDYTCTYYNFGRYSKLPQVEALYYALDAFRYRTEENYISRRRLEELATLFKDGLIEDDEEQALIYFDGVCEMTGCEKEFFGIETENKEE